MPAHSNWAATTLNNSEGTLSHAGTGELQLQLQQMINQQGSLVSNGKVEIIDADIDNRMGIISGDSIHIAGQSGIENDQGNIQAAHVHIHTQGTLNNGRGLISQSGSGDQTIHASSISNDATGRIETNANDLSLAADSIVNTGELVHAGEGDLSVVGRLLTNLGDFFSRGNVSADITTLDNRSGELQGKTVNRTR